MPTREEKIAFIERQRKIKYIKDQQSKNALSSPTDETPEKGNFMLNIIGDQAKKFGKSMVSGTPIAEYVPIVGKPLVDLASKGVNAAFAGAEALTSDAKFSDAYKYNEEQSKKEAEERAKIDAQSYPAMIAKSVAAGTLVPGGTASLTARFIPQTTTKLGAAGKLLSGTAEIAGKNAAMTAADAYSRGLSLDESIDSGKDAAMLSAGLNVAPSVLKGLGSAYRKNVAGLSKDQTDYYRANPQRIMARDFEDESSKLSSEAQRIKDRSSTIKSDVSDEVQSLQDQAKMESQNLRQASLAKGKELKSGKDLESDTLQRNLAEDLSKLQKDARRSVNESAQEALRTAEDSGVNIKLAPFKASLTSRLKNFDIGQGRFGPGVKALEALRTRLDEIGVKEIPAVEFRRLIKSLDDDIDTIMGETAKAGYINPAQRELAGVRSGWKKQMERSVPGYAEAQAKTAGKTRALKGMQEGFDYDPDAVYRQLQGIDKPQNQSQRAALQAFEGEFGGNISPRLEELKTLRSYDPTAEIAPDLRRADEIRQERFKDYFKDRIAEADRLKQVASGVTEKSAPSLMTRYGQNPDKNYAVGRQMDRIAEEANVPSAAGMFQDGDAYSYPMPRSAFSDASMDLANQRAMTGSFTRGSRNTNLGAYSLAGLANKLGANVESLPFVGGIGALLGGASDIIGPSVVRKVIDIVDSPRGQRFKRIYENAAKDGPRAVAVVHNLLMSRDPEYREEFLKGEQ